MTFFLNPLAGSSGSRWNLQSACNNISMASKAGGTHQSVMPVTRSRGQIGAGDPEKISTGAHEIEHSVERKAHRTCLQEAPDSHYGDVLLAASTLAREDYIASTASVPHGQDVIPASLHKVEDAVDYMMTLNPLDLLLGDLNPRPIDNFSRVVTKSLDEKRFSEASGRSAGHEGGAAKGFDLSTKIMSSTGDDESPVAIMAHVQDPETLSRAPAHVKKTNTWNHAKFKPITLLAQKLKLSLGHKLGDRLLEKIKDAKASVGYQKSGYGNLDQERLAEVVTLQQESSGRTGPEQPGSRALGTGTSVPSTHGGLHEERYDGVPTVQRSDSWGVSQHEISVSLSSLPINQLERNSNEDEVFLNLLKEATATVQGSGISEAELEHARDGQSRYMHQNPITLKQSSDQSLLSTGAGGASPFRVRKIAFPEIVAMSPPPSQVPWPRIGGGARASSRAHESIAAPDHSPAAPLQSPNVHQFRAPRGRSTSAGGAPVEIDDSDQQRTFEWLAAGSYRSSCDALAGSALQTKSVTGRDLAHDKLVDLHDTPDQSGVQKAVAKDNPSSAPSPSASLPQAAAFRSQTFSKPLDEAQAENEAHRRIRSYFERNQLRTTQLMSTQQFKLRSEQATAFSMEPMKAAPRRTLHMMEDALLAAVSKTVAAKRSSPTTNASEQLAGDSTEEYPSSKKQRAASSTNPGGEHVIELPSECHSNVPPSAVMTPAAAILDPTISQPVKAATQVDLEDDNVRDIGLGVEYWEELNLVAAGELQDEHVNQCCTQTTLDNDDDDILFDYCM